MSIFPHIRDQPWTDKATLPRPTEAEFLGNAPNYRIQSQSLDLLKQRYDFDAWLLAHNLLPAHAVIITLSGGGTRAAALGQSVLQQLAAIKVDPGSNNGRANLADSVILVSAISGGSMTGAQFALHGMDGLGDKYHFTDKVLRHALWHDALKGLIFHPLVFDRSDQLSDFMTDSDFLGDATYQDLIDKTVQGDANTPFLILSSSDVLSDRSFLFTQDWMSELCADVRKMRLADAAAAASDFPFFFSDVELRNFRTDRRSVCQAPLDASTNKLIAERDNPWRNLTLATEAEYRLHMRLDDLQAVAADAAEPPQRQIKILHLVDGGLSDNLGIRPVLRLLSNNPAPVGSDAGTGDIPYVLNISLPDMPPPASMSTTAELPPPPRSPQKLLEALHARGVKDILLVEVNARSDPWDERYQQTGSLPMAPYFYQPDAAHMDMTMTSSLVMNTSYGPIDKASTLSALLARFYLQTTLDSVCRNSDGEVLGNDCLRRYPDHIYPITVDFDLLQGSVELTALREQVKAISTMEQLDNKGLNAVQQAGRVLLLRDPCLQHFATANKLSLDRVDAYGADHALLSVPLPEAGTKDWCYAITLPKAPPTPP